ncbi:MAG: hypothetical protein NC408_04635 [Candidatus Gastranaerophilales bacterium]|nr:hypothetical protein [Candidatus Gastranaerophilales bacterium]MCM1072242.1 hypothetical protein [Bacteroides sp.]
MGKRFTDTEKFNDPWYRRLTILQKVIWEYLLAECNHAGIFEKLDMDLISFKIGEQITIDNLKDLGERIVFINDETLFIPKFIKFQYGELNPKSKVHSSVLRELNKYSIEYGYPMDTLSIPLSKSIHTLKDKNKDKNKDKYKDIDNTISKQIETLNKDNKENFSKKSDPYINPTKTFFIQEYEKVFKKRPFLYSQDCNRLCELAADYEDIEELIPQALQKLKKINFEGIDFKPSASWLLKGNNFERVMNGEFDNQESRNDEFWEKLEREHEEKKRQRNLGSENI